MRVPVAGAIVSLVTLASFAGARAAGAQGADSAAARRTIYTSSSLRALVAGAASANAAPPPELAGYRAVVETEISVGLRDTLGREHTTQTEQVATAVRWTRGDDRYTQRVIGYRAQSLGLSFSLLSLLGGWTVPTLYGTTLSLGLEGGGGRRVPLPRLPGRKAKAPPPTIHPLSAARDSFYRYAGGDTVAVLHTRTREIPVVRVHVAPRGHPPREALLFDGDIDLDATRLEVVRMRGKLVRVGPGESFGGATNARRGIVAVGFVELVDAEVDGRFWLPAYERTEMQGAVLLLGDARTVFRLVSTFKDVKADTGAWQSRAADDSTAKRLTFAPADSVSAYDAWSAPLGQTTAALSADDFLDLAPANWRPGGEPTLGLSFRRTSELFHFNRIEGAYTGLSGVLRLRDRAPGVEVRAHAGWAWAERTVRGGAGIERRRGDWAVGALAERELASTNDFRRPLDVGATWSALLASRDDYDYVDRERAALFASRELHQRDIVLRVEAGPLRDRAVSNHISRGLVLGDSGFRANRGVQAGDAWRTLATVEYHPSVTGLFLEPGVGARLRYDRADGELRWGRAEGELVARARRGPVMLVGRAQGGFHPGPAAPQTLFEIGRDEGLPGYDYKQFVGDRAAVGRVLAVYTLPVLRAPLRVSSRFLLPGLAPGFSAGAHAGWTELSSAQSRAAADSLLAPLRSIATPTGRIRATVDLRLTLFGGAASVGIARPVDQRAGWRVVWALGEAM